MNKRIKIKKGLIKKAKKLWCNECAGYTNHLLLESNVFHSECLRCGFKLDLDDIAYNYQCPECLTYPRENSSDYLGRVNESFSPTGYHSWTSKFKCHHCGCNYEVYDSN